MAEGAEKMTFDEVVELLKLEHEKAKKLEFVKNPLAYALYKVWKMIDKKKGGAE